MRGNVRYLLIFIIWVWAAAQVNAQSQDRPYWLSVQVGHNEYRGDLGNEFFNFEVGNDFTGGFELSTYLNPSFDLGFNFVFGVIDYDRTFSDGSTESFSNQFINTSLLAHYKLSNGFIIPQDSKVQPYLAGGIGLSSYTGEGSRIVNGEEVSGIPAGSTLSIPLGLGVDIPVSDDIKLVLQSLYNRTFAEGFDGRGMLDNANHDDYFVHSIGIKFGLSKKQDRDGDGVSDSRDRCPTLAGPKRYDGCPDTDGDGFDELSDFCPNVAGVDYLDGCPDTDGDRVEDSKDECPNTAGSIAASGCPETVADTTETETEIKETDSDNDGIIDSNDNCPQQAGSATANGCPDDDGDTIANAQDKCPDQPGVAARNGCPEIQADTTNVDPNLDSDGDGVVDSEDKCPDQPGVAERDGCPEIQADTTNVDPNLDSDGDGVVNSEDKCPDQQGVAERQGCPVAVSQQTRAEVKKIASNLQFAVGQNTFEESSSDDLERLTEIMRNDQNLNLIIDAYTDSEGQAAYNLQLSKQRANAVKDYLIQNGISEDRLRAEGYGEILPIASNDTEEGRKENRRIELTLTYF